MGARFLSAEWVDLHASASATLAERPGVTASVEHQVTKGPDGTVTYHLVWVDGRVHSCGLGGADEPEITVIAPHDVARRLATGELDPSLSFMRGETKVVGNMGKFVSLLPLTQHADYIDFVAAVDAATDY